MATRLQGLKVSVRERLTTQRIHRDHLEAIHIQDIKSWAARRRQHGKLQDGTINFVLLVSRQGKTRLAKWFTTMSPKEKTKIIKDVTQLVLSRRTKMCNFLEYKDTKVIYRRYASLFFITGIDPNDNELLTLEIIHRYVEVLDRYFGNDLCRLLSRNINKSLFTNDHILQQKNIGEMQESSKKTVLRVITQQDAMEEEEAKEEAKK